ncbi:MAG: hypothetical protein ACRD29_26485 [Acidimicrobiales bacterium]
MKIIERLPRAATVVALLLLAIGCSSDDGDAAADASGTTSTVEQEDGSSAFPVTISQAEGEVTIEAEPERAGALDFPSADAAIALGVVPIGMAEVTYVDGGVQAWTAAALGAESPESFDVDDGFPFETIAALDPDVILATNASRTSPTTGTSSTRSRPSWDTSANRSWIPGRTACGRSGRRWVVRARPKT